MARVLDSPRARLDATRAAGMAAALLLAWPAPLHGQTTALHGTVVDSASRVPLRGVQIATLDSAGGKAVALAGTDARGRFRLSLPAAGRYTLRVRSLGYAPRDLDVDTSDSSGEALEIALAPTWLVLDPLQVTASRTTEAALETPAATSVLTRRDVGDGTRLTPVDPIRLLPGVDFASKGLVQSTFTVRGDRGLNQGSMLMLVDDRNAAVPSLGLNVPYLLPVTGDDLERIEVTRGPAAALYGPDAHRGVLHVVTRSPFESRGAALSLAGGERDLFQGSARVAGVLGARLGFRMSGDYFRGRDWERRDSSETGTRDFDLRRAAGEALLEWRPDGATTITAAAGATEAINVIDLTSEAGAVQARDWLYGFAQAKLRRGLLFANVTYNASDAGRTFYLRTADPIKDRSRQVAAQLQHGAETGRLALLYGLDGRWTDPRTDGTIHGRNEEDDLVAEVGGYVQGRAPVARWLELVTAVRVDRNNRLDDLVVSPRAAAVFKPAAGHAIRITYNRAFTAPDASDLFLDLPQGTLGNLPYELRLVALPPRGYRFRRDCEGRPCMRSPYGPAGPREYLPADATALWDVFFPDVPAPQPGEVGSVFAGFDLGTERFVPLAPAEIRDFAPRRRTITEAFEAGYKGLLGGRLRLDAEVYISRVRHPLGSRVTATPNVFFDSTSLESYLRRYLPPEEAAARAGLAALPVGTVSPQEADSTELLFVRRQGGTYTLWGTDVGITVAVTRELEVTGSYSWVNRQVVPGVPTTTDTVVLNVPLGKGALAVTYRQDRDGLTVTLAGRAVGGYPFESGVFTAEEIAPYTVLDAHVSYRLPGNPQLTLSVDAYNMLDRRHTEIGGAPEIGRLAVARIQTRF